MRGRFNRFDATVTIADDPANSSVAATVDLSSVDSNNPDREDPDAPDPSDTGGRHPHR